MAWKHGSKPVIGITGGIGSGKSWVARLFAREGCAVIDSDALAHEVLQSAAVREELRRWLGDGVFEADGSVSRKKVGREVFTDASKLERLNGLIHPRVARMREALMQKYLADGGVKGVVWDTPLLVESGLDRECDVVVFIKVPRELRLSRIRGSRGWGEEELDRREKLQIGLDKKAQVADYCVDNSGDEVATLHQVQQVLSHLSPMSRP